MPKDGGEISILVKKYQNHQFSVVLILKPTDNRQNLSKPSKASNNRQKSPKMKKIRCIGSSHISLDI